MDYKKILKGAGQSSGIFLLFILLIVVLVLVMIAVGPHAPPIQKPVCDTVNATTFCHF
jgi:hypothetical protein